MIRRLSGRNERQYVVVMDIYFTWPKMIIRNRKCGIARKLTARNCKRVDSSWPPKEFHDLIEVRSTTMHYMNDKNSYNVFRLGDNSVVKFDL